MFLTKPLLFFFIITSASLIESYRILGTFPFNGKSHNVMFNALMKGLAKRGHQVDHVTHWPVKNAPKGYNVIMDLNGTAENIVNTFTIDFVRNLSANTAFFCATKYGNDLCELMKLEGIQKLVKNPPNDPPYDVLITEAFGSHCFMGLGHLLKVPVVALHSAAEYPWVGTFIGNDDNLAYAPNALQTRFDKHNFWDRLTNVFTHHYNTYIYQSNTEKTQTDQMRKYLSPDIPNIRDVERSVALTLVNSHPVIYGVKPMTASLVEVGGLHVEENDAKLPPELQRWLDESKDGVVYFSFGSLVLIETLSSDTLQAIYRSLEKIYPIRVLMKIADKSKLPPGLPKNVITSPWIQQQAVLAHKNVKAFVTHGGLMGCQESLYYGVPLIGVPLFADQFRNVANFAAKGMAVEINSYNITTASLDDALNKVLKDPKYSENAKFYSKLFKDRPMSAMNTAVFWIEYVIRNGPLPLRSSALDLNWWQLALLDVYGFILLCSIILLSVICYSIKLILEIIFSAESPRKMKKQ